MKKPPFLVSCALSAGLVLVAAPASEAAILFQENFNYAAGNLVDNSGGRWGMDNVANTTFTVEDAGWGTGMAVKTVPVTNGNQRARTTVDLSGYTNTTVYFSMWVDVLPVPVANGGNGSDNGNRYVAAGIWNGSATSNTEMVYFGKRSDANAGWGIFNTGTGGGNADSSVSPHGVDAPTQLVLRIDFNSAGIDTQKLYAFKVDEIPSMEPAEWIATRDYNFALPANNIVDLRFSSGGNSGGANGNANWGMWDNFGVYTEWSDVFTINAGNVVPEPGSALLVAAAVAGLAMARRRKS